MPSHTLFIHMEVTDFDQWLDPDPTRVEALFRDAGATYERLTRSVEDPNLITIEARFPTVEAAQAFDELGRSLPGEAKNFHARPGGRYETWIATDVEGFEFALAD